MKFGLIKPVLCSIVAGLAWATISTTPALANEAETSYTAYEVAEADTSVPFVTTANLRFRTKPCIYEGIVQTVVPLGETVQVTDFRDGEWFGVKIDGISGYMYSGFLTELYEPAPITYEPAPITYEPAPVLYEPAPVTYEPVPITHEPAPVTYEPAPVTYEPAPVIYEPAPVTYEPAPVQDEPIPVTEVYVEPVSFVATANIMFRSEPCTEDGLVQTVVQRGETVQVTDFRDGEWFEVEIDGASGYINSSFLLDESVIYEIYEPTPVTNQIELMHWSEARYFLPKGVPIQITDVYTGITYMIQSFSHGNHADVETVTPEDTAAMFSTYNGRWCWATRPVLVHIGDRTIAASINGMPHAGATISGNNMNGHVCLHFYGSRIHGSASLAHERDHQNSVQIAYRSGGYQS